MASPRRARSLFLSPEKAELLAAKEINNLVNRVEVIPRKPVPRQGRRTDIGVNTSSGDENRISTTSTINTVDAFCREYRPPSIALHRLSYLNKELPPPPRFETPKQTLSQDSAVSHISTQKHAAVQTTISIQSRYSTRVKPSMRSRISAVSFQQRDPEDRISIRSHSSTQDFPIDWDEPRFEPRASAATDCRRPSVVGDPSKKEARRQDSGITSPGTVPHQVKFSAADDCEIQDPRRQEADTDPRDFADIQRPSTNSDSNQIVLESKAKLKTTVGWTFSDGLILRTDGKPKCTTGMSAAGEKLALEPMIKPMIPIRWTFRDGIIYKATAVPKNEDGMPAAKSNHILPICWSFYDGLTIRNDGSVTNISKTTGESEKIVHGSKSKRMIPIGWSFHDGLTIRPDGSVTNLSKATGENEEIVHGSKSKRMILIGWSFYDGLTIRPDDSVKAISTNTGESKDIVQPKKH